MLDKYSILAHRLNNNQPRQDPMVQHLNLIPHHVIYINCYIFSCIYFIYQCFQPGQPTNHKMQPIACSLIYEGMIKKLVDKLPQSQLKAVSPNLTPYLCPWTNMDGLCHYFCNSIMWISNRYFWVLRFKFRLHQ